MTKKKGGKCSTCRRPVRGHPKPVGKHCNMDSNIEFDGSDNISNHDEVDQNNTSSVKAAFTMPPGMPNALSQQNSGSQQPAVLAPGISGSVPIHGAAGGYPPFDSSRAVNYGDFYNNAQSGANQTDNSASVSTTSVGPTSVSSSAHAPAHVAPPAAQGGGQAPQVPVSSAHVPTYIPDPPGMWGGGHYVTQQWASGVTPVSSSTQQVPMSSTHVPAHTATPQRVWGGGQNYPVNSVPVNAVSQQWASGGPSSIPNSTPAFQPWVSGGPTPIQQPWASSGPTSVPQPWASAGPTPVPQPWASGGPTPAPQPWASGGPSPVPQPWANSGPPAFLQPPWTNGGPSTASQPVTSAALPIVSSGGAPARWIPADHDAIQDGIPEKTVSAALRGEFIKLEHFLPSFMNINQDEQQLVENDDGTISTKPKSVKKNIVNFQKWLEAFIKYQDLIVKYYGYHAYLNMSKYILHILSCSKKYMWSTVYIYDVRHRMAVAKAKSFDFALIDSNLLNTTLDATAVRPNASRCRRCMSYDHIESDGCPFPSGAGTVTARKTKTVSQEVCNNFNEERCNFQGCRRRHVCKFCGSSQPYKRCSQSCQSRGSVSTLTSASSRS